MIADVSAAARRQAIKNALVCVAGTFAAWLAASLGFAVVLGQPTPISFLLGLALVVAVLYLLLLGTWFRGRRRAGAVLLDCGPNPSQKRSLASAEVYFLVGLVMSALGRSSVQGLAFFGWLLMLQGIFTALMAYRHFQLREHGLWNGTSLLPWNKIESYWWDEGRTLMLTTKSSPWSFKRGAFLVPVELQQAVDQWLGRMVPAPERTT
jgi:hypothetical protein